MLCSKVNPKPASWNVAEELVPVTSSTAKPEWEDQQQTYDERILLSEDKTKEKMHCVYEM
jgi:hypothetical protein